MKPQGPLALAVLAHELRVPLGAVLGAVAALENTKALPEAARTLCALMRRNLLHAGRLVDDGLELARAANGTLKMRSELVDLHQVVSEAVVKFEAPMRERQVELRVELKAARHHVRGDSLRLSQVLWNLVQNAMKFTPAGGFVDLRTSSARGLVRMDVIDSGIGMSQAQQGQVFKPFVQQGGAEHDRGGLGLGLFLCKAFVEGHGGRITVQSAGSGQGSRFTVELPAARASRAAAPPAAELPPAGGGHATVLLVDDHADTLEALGLLLRQHGYEVRTAASLAAALGEARHQIDLVISDLSLPDGTGIALMRRLRSQQDIEGIAVSGFGSRRDVQAAKRAGFRVHLTKPVPPGLLLETVGDLTRPRGRRDTRRA
jgi:CheY-like chemotaxis protein